jgi:hypothetical protein
MALHLEGDLNLERAQTRRWVSIIAVVIPVGACALLAAGFIRTYIVPPTVGIPSVTTVAQAVAQTPPPPPAIPRRAAIEAPPPPIAVSALGRDVPLSRAGLPMVATLAAAPPAVVSATPAAARSSPVQAEPAPSASLAVSPAPPAEPRVATAQPTATSETPETTSALVQPIAESIPLPRSRPHHFVTFASRAIPLPRPKPVDDTAPESDLPAIDRHAIN